MKKFTEELATELKSLFETASVRDALGAMEKSQDAESGTFEVVITTENLDRYEEVISLSGWELEHYRNNPVVLWGHDHSCLIGMATSVEVVDGKMIAKGKFAPTEQGQEVRKLYDAGFLRATSVGFIEKERQGNLITKAELLEFSFVSVPANPYALALAMEKELNMNELVTKGFMNIKETEPVTIPEKKDEETTPEPEVTPEPEEKKFSTKAVTPIVEQLKGVITALEALSDGEPEREEEPTGETEEEKELRIFAEKRKLLQEVSTIVSDVLAGARKAMEAQK